MARGFPIVAALLGVASAVVLGAPRASTETPAAGDRAEGKEGALVQLAPIGEATGDASATTTSLDEALRRRRSVRTFAPRALTPRETSRLLWSAQGVTDAASGGRTAPSAGALHPLEVYLVAPAGVFRYSPSRHALERLTSDDRRSALAGAALGQGAVSGAGADIVLAGVVSRTAAKYGARAERYVLLEAGHAAQNVLLEAVALGLDAVPVGAFTDADVARTVGLRAGETPLYIVAVGAPVR